MGPPRRLWRIYVTGGARNLLLIRFGLLEAVSNFFGLPKDTLQVQPRYFFDVRFGVPAPHQLSQQCWITGNIFQSFDRSMKAFEVRANSDVIDAGNFSYVINMIGHIRERGGRRLGMSFAPGGMSLLDLRFIIGKQLLQ